MLCTSCAHPIPEGARFCPSCGHAIATGQTEERRIVTVVFADLVGFTSLAEFLDPEQVKRLVDSCFELLVDDITSFGGRVDKILGDGILSLFGAPVAHEDDPERAVRAALRMQQTLARHVETSEMVGSADIRMRVGVNTGEVLVGTLAGTDYTAMGDVVNIASRLQEAAAPGTVLVGETTYALTSHTFHYESVGELAAKGREQGVRGWMAVEAIAPPGASRRRRSDVSMVGRDLELALGRAALELATTRGTSVLLAVSGENGVGKSRLIDELVEHLRTTVDAFVLEGACAPYGEANVWWPIASALSNFIDIEPGTPAETVREIARTRGAELHLNIVHDDAERLLDIFMHLLGYPSPVDRLDPASALSAIHRFVTKILELRTEDRPVVLSIDDLHWADPMLVDLLAHLVQSLSRRPFALITAMRPGSEISWPPSSDLASVVSLTLQPLSRGDTELLAAELLRDLAPDAKLLTALYERSGGNPLFLHELAALTQAGGSQRELPDSLRTLIGARLDQLTPDQRQVLDNAATLGTAGSVFALEHFAEETGQEFRPATLRELDDLGLLLVHGHRWEFRSDSVREAAYQTLTKAARAVRHAGVAKAMRNYSPAGLEDVAHHAATAAELVQELGPIEGVPTRITGDAIALLTAAAERALLSGSLRAAVRNATRALDLMRPSDDNREAMAQLQLLRAEALVEQRSYAAARADIDTVLAYATEYEDLALEAESRRLLGSLHHLEGHLELGRVELGAAVELLRTTDTPDRLARALRARGFIELFGGSLVDAEWFFGEADAIYRSLEDQRGMAWIEQHRAWISFLSGDLDEAHARLHHAAETLGRLGDRNGVGWAFGLLAFVEFFQRHFDEAEALAETVSHDADERGDDWAAGMMQTLLANMRLWQGKLDDAVRLAEQARARFRKLNDKFGMIQSLGPLIRVQVALGRTAAAQRSAEELMALAETSAQGPFPLLAVAGAAMHRGDAKTAVAMAERAIAETQAIGGNPFESTIILAMALAQAGRLDDALATLESVGEIATDHPFTNAVAAVVHALARNSQTAIRHADAVAKAPGSTYLDQVFAYVAAAGAHAQLGQMDQAALSAQAAVARAMNVGDVVASALATRSFERLTGEPHPATDQRTQLAAGWEQILHDLFDRVAA